MLEGKSLLLEMVAGGGCDVITGGWEVAPVLVVDGRVGAEAAEVAIFSLDRESRRGRYLYGLDCRDYILFNHLLASLMKEECIRGFFCYMGQRVIL